jgi:hypothetical protein
VTTIGGTIREVETGRPIGGVTVRIVTPAVDAGLSTTSNDNGSYRLEGIQSTTFTVEFTHPNYQTLRFEYTFRPGTERLDLTTQLFPGSNGEALTTTIGGTVTRLASLTPVPNVSVRIVSP